MSLFCRATPSALRNLAKRGGGSESFWSEGKKGFEGFLFGETPPPPGQKRKAELWEYMWVGTFGAATLILGVGLWNKPDTNITSWAREEAAKDLAKGNYN